MYADYDFYNETYYGDIIPAEKVDKWLTRSSDELDLFTFGRLHDNFPTDEISVDKIKKAVCEVAEALFQIDEQSKAVSYQKDKDGSYHGAISSISSGRESVTYQGGSSANAFSKAACDDNERQKLIFGIVNKYLTNITDSTGVNLLYAGVDCDVQRYDYYF